MTKLDHIGPIRPVGPWHRPYTTSMIAPTTRRRSTGRNPQAPAEAADAAAGLEPGDRIMILTWLHLADRSSLTTRPRDDPDREPVGVFATRSADRPNPIGVHTTTIGSEEPKSTLHSSRLWTNAIAGPPRERRSTRTGR